MQSSLWRPAFTQYIQGFIAISEWSLDDPMRQLVFDSANPWAFQGNTVAFLPPLVDSDISFDNPREPIQRATQELFVLTRFDRRLKYHEIPLNKLEGIWSTLSTLVTVNFNRILTVEQQSDRGILGMQVAARQYPVSVQPIGEKDSDWIATLSWAWHVRWVVDLEAGQITEPYQIKSVRGNVYRSNLLDFQDKILDFSGLLAPLSQT